MDNGIEIPCMTGTAYCSTCMAKLAQGVCSQCSFANGEMDDVCRQCGASLSLASTHSCGLDTSMKAGGQRKLRANASHPEAPEKKMPFWADTLVHNEPQDLMGTGRSHRKFANHGQA